MTPTTERIAACRSCRSRALAPVLSYGETPLADRLVHPEAAAEAEPTAPLDLVLCTACGVAQITATVPPHVLFGGNYPYYSSVSDTLLAACRENAVELVDRLALGVGSLVVEVASNDGYMLGNFTRRGIPVLGIDPARGPVAEARRRGVRTWHRFFGPDVAAEVLAGGAPADLVIANNVLAHVPDPNTFVACLERILAPGGLVVAEVHDAGAMVAGGQFDTVYHQHLCYFTLTGLANLFRRNGLSIHEVRRIPSYGGSLRVYADRTRAQGESVTALLAEERQRGLDRLEPFAAFARQAHQLRRQLRDLVCGLKGDGARVVAYGAAAKATTLLHFCGLDSAVLDYVVDRNPHKHGLLMGGNRLPIYPTQRLLEDGPDFVLLLAWNYAQEVMAQQAEYRRRGGRFILPVPEVRIA